MSHDEAALGKIFAGTWRIVEMEVWSQEFVDLVGPGHLVFRGEGSGRFQFVAVRGDMDCRFADRVGKPLVEFSWSGFDDADAASGRGWAVADGDLLRGRVFIHGCDDSAFTARRSEELPAAAPRARSRAKRRK